MAKVKVMRAFDPYNDDIVAFSIVTDGSGVDFVFPNGGTLFDGDQRVKYLLDISGAKPKTSDAWLDLAMTGLDSFMFKNVDTDGIDSDIDAISIEKDFFKDSANSLVSTTSSKSIYEAQRAANKLSSQDDEILSYLNDPSVGLSVEKRKLLMATMIIAAGTVEYNPWLMPWLNGEDLDPKTIDTRLVLSKPSDENVYSESLVTYEGETE
jgi:hypothetical protein